MTQTKGVLAFLILSFGLTWLNWELGWLLGFSVDDLLFQVITLPTLFTPAIATIIVRRWITREGFGDAGLRPNFKKRWPYYLLAWSLVLLIYMLIVVLAMILGFLQPEFSLLRETAIPLSGFHLPVWMAFMLLMGLTPFVLPLYWGEEFGWRGYLQVRLLSQRPVLAAVATGVIWGIWHYPLLFHGYAGYTNILTALTSYTGQTVLLSFIYGWLRARSGSVWPGCLYHAANNVLYGQFFMPLFVGAGKLDPVTWDLLSWVFLGIFSLWIILSGQLKMEN